MILSLFISTFLKADTYDQFEEADGYESFQEFCIERKEKLDNLKQDEQCPGEIICTTSEKEGVCKRLNVNLQDYCKRDRCKLFYTKADSTPVQYVALLETAIRQTERKLSDFEITDEGLSLFEYEAKIVFDRAHRIAENKKYENERDEQNSQQPNNTKGQPGRGFIKGDSDAFNFTPEQREQMFAARQRRQKINAERVRRAQLLMEQD